MQLVMQPSPCVSPETVVAIPVYTDKAILHGKGSEVREMIVRGIP